MADTAGTSTASSPVVYTRVLGGEAGRRGFFGGRANRTRMTGLVLVAVVGAVATVALRTAGLALAVLAAAVVYAGTARTHRGSVLARWIARRRWAERVAEGTTSFAPLAQRPPELHAAVCGITSCGTPAPTPRPAGAPLPHHDHTPGVPGGSPVPAPRGKAARRELARAWNAYRDWPDGAEGMHWLARGRGEPGIAWHVPTGESAYLSVAFAVEGQVRGVESAAGMAAAATAFGDLLTRYGSPGTLPDRVQCLTRVVPVDSAFHEAWVWDALDDTVTAADTFDSPTSGRAGAMGRALAASYDEVVRLVAAAGLMQRHYVVVRWPLSPTFVAAARRRGPAQAGWRALMAAEIDAVASHLRATRLGQVSALSAAQLAAVLRHLQHPSWPIDQAADVDVAAPWVPSVDEWSTTHTRGPGPDGTEQSWWHRTAVLPIEAFETGPRTSWWAAPLLSACPHPIVRTLSLQTEVIPAAAARAAARADVTADLADLDASRRKGILTDEELTVALAAARGRLDDLAPGSGHHGAAWCGHLSISARTREDLVDASAKITEAAANAGITHLAWCDTYQGAAMASCWPLARGMRPTRTGAAGALRGLLAGTGAKEAI